MNQERFSGWGYRVSSNLRTKTSGYGFLSRNKSEKKLTGIYDLNCLVFSYLVLVYILLIPPVLHRSRESVI